MHSVSVKMKVACPQRLLARGRAVFASFIAGSKPTSLYYKGRVWSTCFSIWVVAVATAALDEPTLEVYPDEVIIDLALETGKAFMGAFLTASEVTAGLTKEVDSW